MRLVTMDIAVSEIMELLEARLLSGSPQMKISGFASLKDAGQGDLSFYSDPRYRESLAQTRAIAVLVPDSWTELLPNVAALAVSNPSVAFEKVVERYGIQPEPFRAGVHDSAVVGNCVRTNLDRISVGANAVIGDGAQIGDDSEIGAGCFVGSGVTIGKGCTMFANSTVHQGCILGDRVILHSGVVIGADGFGFEFENGRHRKIRQAGIAQLDDDVEIGAGSMVDRARFGRTWIGEGTKIDNLVQIGHNVVIGKHCIIISQSGIAGSSRVGDHVVIAAQVGVVGHVTIGSRCTIAARTVVTKDVPAGSKTYMGFPVAPAMEERRRMVVQRQLPQLLERLKELERRLEEKQDQS